ncbi:MAG TPA: SRPBCC family protein [Acidimicrobiales bacterium]|jgi:carbon monoxide dehydrogenase subunit G|nr:SRPBCC family protein [Acidimicrobiales bacterium]
MRGSQRRDRVIGVSADRAWAVIGRPEVLHLWFPGIVDCTVEGDTRTITTGMGLQLREQILTNDRLQRRFQYRISGGVFHEHLASLDVVALDEGSCLVTYASDADPAAMAVILGGAMESALAELARQLESGSGPAVDALTKEA